MLQKNVGKKNYKTGDNNQSQHLLTVQKILKKLIKLLDLETFVAGAKKEVFGDVGIDMIAGPSEVS